MSLVCPLLGQSDLMVLEDDQRPVHQPLWGWGKLPALPAKIVHPAASEFLKAAPPEGGCLRHSTFKILRPLPLVSARALELQPVL